MLEQSILALVAFTFTAAITPGPNNVMLMASAVNFGLRRSVPHMLGVILGFPAMICVIGLGFGATIVALPWFHDLVSAIGIPYLLWLSWKIASADTSRGLQHEDSSAEPIAGSNIGTPRPMTFISASAFQWVNAKAWVMAIGMLAVYAPKGVSVESGIAIIVGVNVVTAVISTLVWTAFGSVLATWLKDPKRLTYFNVSMAALLVATLIPAILELTRTYL